MNYSLINESFAVFLSLVISWTFGFWVFYELRPENNKRRVATITVMAIVIVIVGFIFPAYFLSKCYYQYVLRHLAADEVASVQVGNVTLEHDTEPLIATLNKVEWFVPLDSGGWSKLVRAGGLPLRIKRKDGGTYKFRIGYYLGNQALVSFPMGGCALSKNLPKVLRDLGLPLP